MSHPVGSPSPDIRRIVIRSIKDAEDLHTQALDEAEQPHAILLSLEAVRSLLELHPKANGFRLEIATDGDSDIESVKPNLVVAKVSATDTGTRKFKKDMARLASNPARHRYMFLAKPGGCERSAVAGDRPSRAAAEDGWLNDDASINHKRAGFASSIRIYPACLITDNM
jgi:hypothetical protein